MLRARPGGMRWRHLVGRPATFVGAPALPVLDLGLGAWREVGDFALCYQLADPDWWTPCMLNRMLQHAV